MRAYDTERGAAGRQPACWRIGALDRLAGRIAGGLLARCWPRCWRLAGALLARVPSAALFSLRVSPFSGILDGEGGSTASEARQPATVTDALTIHEEPAGLRRPILILAFAGWNDAAESATGAARYLGQLWPSRPFASIDPEDFYHFGLSRPYVRFKAGSRTEREVIWPSTEFSLAQPDSSTATSSWASPVEPHLKWRTYCGALLDLARRSGASLVLTLGALLAEVSHTRPVRLVGSAFDRGALRPPGPPAHPLRGAHRHRGRARTRCAASRRCPPRASGRTCRTTSRASRIPRPPWRWCGACSRCSNTEADLTDLEESTKQFEQNLEEIVSQNAKIAEYIKKLERKKPDEGEEEPPAAAPERATSFRPPATWWPRSSSSCASSAPTRPDSVRRLLRRPRVQSIRGPARRALSRAPPARRARAPEW